MRKFRANFLLRHDASTTTAFVYCKNSSKTAGIVLVLKKHIVIVMKLYEVVACLMLCRL